MDKQEILTLIRRIASERGGRAPGQQVFERESGVKKSEWYPQIWLRWSDALVEAGFAPNTFQERTNDQALLGSYADLAKELGRLPVEGEIRRKARSDPSFPSHTTFRRFGGKQNLLEALAAHCRRNPGLEDVLTLCVDERSLAPQTSLEKPRGHKVPTGFVYLMKSGVHYKIGRTKSIGRREAELTTKIPIPPRTVHRIETDDPEGIEKYWHERFRGRRGQGEWFTLTPEDVEAFKRWKRIV